MVKKPITGEQRVVLPKVSWQEFEKLLLQLRLERKARFTYDRGKLELMTPLEEHERCNKLIESLILVLVDELDLRVFPLHSVVLKQFDRQRAIEPDACYYLQNQPAMSVESATATELDLTQIAPPDLVVEVAISKSSLDKLSIYADMGVPEVWRYITTSGEAVLKGKLQIYQLQNGRYRESPNSLVFSFLPATKVLQFLEHSDTLGLAKALIVLREWIKETL